MEHSWYSIHINTLSVTIVDGTFLQLQIDNREECCVEEQPMPLGGVFKVLHPIPKEWMKLLKDSAALVHALLPLANSRGRFPPVYIYRDLLTKMSLTVRGRAGTTTRSMVEWVVGIRVVRPEEGLFLILFPFFDYVWHLWLNSGKRCIDGMSEKAL